MKLSTDSEPRPKHDPESAPTTTSGPVTSLTHRASWVFLARLLSFAFSIVLPLLLTRRLSQEDFGVYKLVFLVINTAAVMLPLGVSMSAYYFLSRETEDRNATVLNILLFLTATGTLGGLSVTLFPGILTYIVGDASLESLAPSVGLLLTLWIIGSFLQIAPIANQEERLGSILILGSSLSRTAMLVGSAVLIATVPALIVAAQLHATAQIVVLLFYVVSRFPGFWRAFDLRMLGRQLAYALPFGASGLLYTFQTDVHNYFVSHEFGPTVFAIYAIGCFQLPLVGMLTDAAASVLIPQVSRFQRNGETEKIIHLSLRAGRKLGIVLLPLFGFLTIAGEEFITVLFTSQYVESLPIFRINLVMLLFGIIPTDPIIRAYPKYRYWMLTLMAVLTSALMAALVWVTPQYGMVGVIATVLAVRLTAKVSVTIGLARLLGVGRAHAYLFGDTAKALIATASAMLAAGLLRVALLDVVPIGRLAACGGLFGLIYVALLAWQRVPEPDEVQALKKLALAPLQLARRIR